MLLRIFVSEELDKIDDSEKRQDRNKVTLSLFEDIQDMQ